MISLLSLIITTIVHLVVYLVKAVFSLIDFYIKALWKILRLFIALLPITGIIYTLCFVLTLIQAIIQYDPIPAEFPFHLNLSLMYSMFENVVNSWQTYTQSNQNSWIFLFIIVLTIILCIPIACSLMAIFAFISCFYYLIVTALIDLFMYLILSLFTRNSIIDIFKRRYYKLFPAAGTKHYQESYEKWLRKHHEEFENDEPADKRIYEKNKKKNRKIQKFYDEDEYNEDNDSIEYHRSRYSRKLYDESDYDEDLDDEDYDADYDEDYDEDYAEDLDDDEDSYSNYDEDSTNSYNKRSSYQKSYYKKSDNQRSYNQNSSQTKVAADNNFNFFAGCNSLESIDKKYKQLVKLYHPDNPDGDTKALAEINIQYDKAKAKFR